MVGKLQPLVNNQMIVGPDGKPTEYFIRWAQQRQIDIGAGIDQAQAEQIVQDFIEQFDIQAGGGISITPDGKLTSNPTISANAQEILDQISDVHGTVLFRGAADWQALAPGTAGQFLKTNGADADPEWAAGGGGGGGYFNAVASSPGSLANTIAAATKGMLYLPDADLQVTHVSVVVDSAATADAYTIQVWSVTGVTINSSSGDVDTMTTVAKVGEATTPQSPNSVAEKLLRFQLDAPASLTGGTYYLIVVVYSNAALGTSVLRIMRGTPFMAYAFPGFGFPTLINFNTIGLSASQTFTSRAGDNPPFIWPEGTTA